MRLALGEHFEACSRVRALDGVRGLENTGMSRVPSILGSMASAGGQTNLFHSHSCILSHYTVISPDENVKCDFYEDASLAKVGRWVIHPPTKVSWVKNFFGCFVVVFLKRCSQSVTQRVSDNDNNHDKKE